MAWALFNHELAPTYTKGTVAIMGDAAHWYVFFIYLFPLILLILLLLLLLLLILLLSLPW
jgi:hypothetical protein